MLFRSSLPPAVQAPAPLSSFLFRRRSKFPAAPAADASAVTLTADRRSVVLYLVPSLKFLFIFSRLLLLLYHEPALTRFTACCAGCSFSNGTRKTNAAFGVACFSFVLIISYFPCDDTAEKGAACLFRCTQRLSLD